ncbi:MAG: phosphohydrolase [Sedimenticola sp.]|jgi:HD-like signal output (HDOD) protein|nr:MAG: phosphohydrolase [Sedimenticola sp.]
MIQTMNPEQLVAEITGLFSLPEVCLKINALVEDPRASAEDIAKLISQDTDLTARLLKTVNSAFYGLKVPVETISRAITIIGTKDLHNLAIMTSACDLFNGIPADLLNMDDFWHRSVACGALAQDFGKKCCVLHPERLLVMGVLHDIGRLAILQKLPELARDVLLVSQGKDELLLEAEQEVLGFNHCEVGGLLAESWGLPASICNAVRYHHQPMVSKKYLTETAIIHVSHVMAAGMHRGGDIEEVLGQIDTQALSFLKLTQEDCMLAFGNVADEVREMYAILVGYGAASQQAE